jgi:hypothetical protein
MKFQKGLLMLLAMLAALGSVSALDVSVDQLLQMMENSDENLTTYTYTRTAESRMLFSNESLHEEFNAVKTTEGKVNIVDQEGWWGAKLNDRMNQEDLTWEGYFLNGSEYWKEGLNWTKFMIEDKEGIMDDYNEFPGQVDLLRYSDMSIVGQEICEGEECYKLTGTPQGPIAEGIIGLQLVASYFPAPFPLPEELKSRSFDMDETELYNNSGIELTAWVSKNSSLLKRLNINASLAVSPEILGITGSYFMIESTLNESTVYQDFGSDVIIELPKEAQNESIRAEGTDWRWAAFGSVRP